MNLLTDAWIPVNHAGSFKQITYEKLLCRDEAWEIALPRDDMEMACLQLLVCLTQVIFLPRDVRELRKRIEQPLNPNTFAGKTERYHEWFDLDHATTPFMQIRGVNAKEPTPIQKLFVGLPEGNNHAFFNEPGEIKVVCPSCAAISLFNQNSNAPGFSGKQKAGIRGPNPVTTLVSSRHPRKYVWMNVLHQGVIERKALAKDEDRPVWREPIVPQNETANYIKETKSKKNADKRKSIHSDDIGIFRGLFWLPVLIELSPPQKGLPDGKCDACGIRSSDLFDSFRLDGDFYFNVIGNWPHPHTPRFWNLKKEKREEKYLSFKTLAPGWTQLSRFVVEHQGERAGHVPAAVVEQYRQLFPGQRLELSVGGYRNKKALILQRRHEFFSIGSGWGDHLEGLRSMVETALEFKQVLRERTYGFSKELGLSGLPGQVESRFYHLSETMIHEVLRSMDWRQSRQMLAELRKALSRLCMEIFESITQPYQHEPKMMKALASARRGLRIEFQNICGGRNE